MHAVYVLYLFLCIMQLPVFITLYSVGYRIHSWSLHELKGVHLLDPANQTMAVFQVGDRPSDLDAALMCGAAGLFGVLYMLLTNADHHRLSNEFLIQSDAGPPSSSSSSSFSQFDDLMLIGSSSVLLNPDEAYAHRCLHAIRACFWLFVWLHGAALHTACIRYARPAYAHQAPLPQDIWLFNIGRALVLYATCRTVSWQRNRWVAVMLWLAWCAAVLRTKALLLLPSSSPQADDHDGGILIWVLLIAQCFAVDGVLMLSHHYDADPTIHIIVHARLFFVAWASVLVQWANLLTAARLHVG